MDRRGLEWKDTDVPEEVGPPPLEVNEEPDSSDDVRHAAGSAPHVQHAEAGVPVSGVDVVKKGSLCHVDQTTRHEQAQGPDRDGQDPQDEAKKAFLFHFLYLFSYQQSTSRTVGCG